MKRSLPKLQRVVLLLVAAGILAGLEGRAAAVEAAAEIAFNGQWAERAFGGSGEASPAGEGDLAARLLADAELPLSFVYGGKSSAELLGTWKRSVEDKRIDDTRRQRIVTLEDPETGLEVRAVATVYTDAPGVDWTIYFTNKGNRDSRVLEQVKAVDVRLRPGAAEKPPVLHRLRSDTENWLPLDEPLAAGQRVEFAPVRGRSSTGACPFFNVELNGGGVITAIGWTGQWVAAVERVADDVHDNGRHAEPAIEAASGGDDSQPAHLADVLVRRGAVSSVQPISPDDVWPHRAQDRGEDGDAADCASEHGILRDGPGDGSRRAFAPGVDPRPRLRGFLARRVLRQGQLSDGGQLRVAAAARFQPGAISARHSADRGGGATRGDAVSHVV